MTENRQITQYDQGRFPAHFDSAENISFNHRMLTLYLVEEKLTQLGGGNIGSEFSLAKWATLLCRNQRIYPL